MPIENLEERLSALDDNFKKASIEGYTNDLADLLGTHSTVLRELDFFEGKTSGEAFIKFVFEIVLSRELNGREIEVIHSLEPSGPPDFVDMKLGFLKKDLKTLGVPVDSEDFTFAQVRPGSAAMEAILDAPVQITVKESKKINPNTGRSYVNAYVDARLGDSLPGLSDVPPGPEPVAAPTDDPDDVPF